MQMRDDIKSLGKQNVEHEEAMQTLVIEQQQNAQQVKSHVGSKLNNEIGMKGAYTSPPRSKQLQGISKASDAPEDRKSFESKATEVKEMDHELEEGHQVEYILRVRIFKGKHQITFNAPA